MVTAQDLLQSHNTGMEMSPNMTSLKSIFDPMKMKEHVYPISNAIKKNLITIHAKYYAKYSFKLPYFQDYR